jgi:gp16 family phage-associated protein
MTAPETANLAGRQVYVPRQPGGSGGDLIYYPAENDRHTLPQGSPMKNAPHVPLPYPQTPASAHAALRAAGICISHWARDLGLSRMAVADALRGKNKGHRGMAHRAAVALGLKPAAPAAPAKPRRPSRQPAIRPLP